MGAVLKIEAGKLIGVTTSIFTIFNLEKYDAAAIPAAWQEFFAKVAGSKLAQSEIYYGVSIPSMSFDAPMDYTAGVLVDSDFQAPAEFSTLDLPAGNYLTVEHLGPITGIADSYKRAYMEELPQSGMEMRPAPHLEIYRSQLNPMDNDYRMSIGIPVI